MSSFPADYRFHHLTQVPSTNMHAMQAIYEGLAGNGDVFFADYQSEGKGQRGKSWLSHPNESILMSVVLDTSKLAASQSFRLSATISVAVRDFLTNLLNEKIFIKWPNDLYINDRKAGGILIENVLNLGVLRKSVIGIGININQQYFPEDLPGAVSVSMLTGERYKCATLVEQLTACIDKRWNELLAGGWPIIFADYNQHLYGKNAVKRLRQGSVVIPALIKHVDQQGVLVAGESDEWHFKHGEVEWIL